MWKPIDWTLTKQQHDVRGAVGADAGASIQLCLRCRTSFGLVPPLLLLILKDPTRPNNVVTANWHSINRRLLRMDLSRVSRWVDAWKVTILPQYMWLHRWILVKALHQRFAIICGNFIGDLASEIDCSRSLLTLPQFLHWPPVYIVCHQRTEGRK